MMIEFIRRSKIKIYSIALASILPLSSFALEEKDNNTTESKKDNRASVGFKQRHSSKTTDDLYADGIKIKRDLTLIKEIQEARIFDKDEIPADDIYGGIWSTTRVNAYADLKSPVDTFNVDLSNFVMPTAGYITSNFGMRKRRMHKGIDLKVQVGDTIYAAFDGKVRLCQFERRGYGYYTVLRHTNGLESVYGHLSAFLVKENDVVKAGDPIALGGNTGRSSGAHLHLEFRFLGAAFDPNKIVDFANKVCYRDAYTITPGTFNYAGVTSKTSLATRLKDAKPGTNKYVAGKVNYHRVKRGDTLYNISKRYGMSVSKLCSINKISQKSTLKLGKALKIS